MSSLFALIGPNFSGKSRWLSERRARNPWPRCAFIGPYPEAALTGLAWRVRDELKLATVGNTDPLSWMKLSEPFDLNTLWDRDIHVLSGGETALLALSAALRPATSELQVDIALEQLDSGWRKTAISFLSDCAEIGTTIAVADNRLDQSEREKFSHNVSFEPDDSQAKALLEPATALSWIKPVHANDLKVENVTFAYPRMRSDVLQNISLKLKAGKVYFLQGPNGAGKTTFVRLLTGTVLAQKGQIFFGEELFCPETSRMRFVSLAFQNPDFQWTSLSLYRELVHAGVSGTSDLRAAIEAFGVPQSFLKWNPVDLPFAIKKRVGVAIAFLSKKPWLVFDEPTLSQDTDYCAGFAKCVTAAVTAGRSIIVISHDRRLKSMLPYTSTLDVANQSILATELTHQSEHTTPQ